MIFSDNNHLDHESPEQYSQTIPPIVIETVDLLRKLNAIEL